MNVMEEIHHHMEAGRQSIIHRLEEELAHFQKELERIPDNSTRECDAWGARIYNKLIARKQKLLTTLM